MEFSFESLKRKWDACEMALLPFSGNAARNF